MSTERSDTVYGFWRDASEKFDYFVTGVTGALVAFIAEGMEPTPIAWDARTVELAAMLLLVGSVIVGFKRIESTVTAFRLMHQRLYKEEMRGSLVSTYEGRPLLNSATGNVLSPAEIEHQAQLLGVEVRVIREKLDELTKRSGSYYVWRNRLLLIGFLLLIGSRVLDAYM